MSRATIPLHTTSERALEAHEAIGPLALAVTEVKMRGLLLPAALLSGTHHDGRHANGVLQLLIEDSNF